METIKYLNSDDLELIHFTSDLFFYKYKNWSGIEDRIYIGSKQECGPDITYVLNSEEFGFVDVKSKSFKLTEDVWLTYEDVKHIAEFIKELEKRNA